MNVITKLYLEGEWVDISSDVVSPIRFSYGIRSCDILERTATTGTLSLFLDNSSNCYSPDHESATTDFEIGCPIAIKFDDTLKWVGKISAIAVAPGKFGKRTTQVDALDWFDEAARLPAKSLPLMVGLRTDEVILELLKYCNTVPLDIDFDDGLSTLSLALGKANTTVYAELKKLALSEFGYIYLRGGTLVFENRHRRIQNTTPEIVLSDDPTDNPMKTMVNKRELSRIKNIVRTIVHPTDIDGAPVVLGELSGSPPAIKAQGTLALEIQYQDEDHSYDLVGATETEIPIRNTDYTLNTSSGGGGADASLDIREAIKATEAGYILAYFPMNDQSGLAIRDEIHPQVPAVAVRSGTGSAKSTGAVAGQTGYGTSSMVQIGYVPWADKIEYQLWKGGTEAP